MHVLNSSMDGKGQNSDNLGGTPNLQIIDEGPKATSNEGDRTTRKGQAIKHHRAPNHISKTVPPTVHSGPPTLTVDTAIFEMSLGSLSSHEGLVIPVV